MPYTAGQLARLAGVTPRTLRWYEAAGLLAPPRGENGYRQYGEAETARLQQILFFREAGLELADIGRILNEPAFDAAEALQRHLQGLYHRKSALDALIATAEKTLEHMKGNIAMTDEERFEGFKKQLVENNEQQYGTEVRSRWGSEAADAANAKMMKMTPEEYAAFEQLTETLNTALAEAVQAGAGPTGPQGQAVAALHKQWLCHTWPKYNAQAHKNLAQMYVDDERFAAYYNNLAPGAALFLRDAVAAMVDAQ